MSKSDESINSDKQTLVQHLTELRSRLIKSLILICIVFVVFYLFRPTSKKENDQFNDKNNWRGGF